MPHVFFICACVPQHYLIKTNTSVEPEFLCGARKGVHSLGTFQSLLRHHGKLLLSQLPCSTELEPCWMRSWVSCSYNRRCKVGSFFFSRQQAWRALAEMEAVFVSSAGSPDSALPICHAEHCRPDTAPNLLLPQRREAMGCTFSLPNLVLPAGQLPHSRLSQVRLYARELCGASGLLGLGPGTTCTTLSYPHATLANKPSCPPS